MAIIKTIKGDLIKLFKEGEFTAIAHGANCFAKMGAGIAAQIRYNFPEAYGADKAFTETPFWKLGRFSSAKTDCGTVFNLYTQYEPGRNFEYMALRSAIDELEIAVDLSLGGVHRMKADPIGIPLIGAGIGGGNWDVIKNIFEMSSLNFIVVEWEKC